MRCNPERSRGRGASNGDSAAFLGVWGIIKYKPTLLAVMSTPRSGARNDGERGFPRKCGATWSEAEGAEPQTATAPHFLGVWGIIKYKPTILAVMSTPRSGARNDGERGFPRKCGATRSEAEGAEPQTATAPHFWGCESGGSPENVRNPERQRGRERHCAKRCIFGGVRAGVPPEMR